MRESLGQRYLAATRAGPSLAEPTARTVLAVGPPRWQAGIVNETSPGPDANKIVGLLATDERRRVVAALILGASRTDDIANTAGLGTKATQAALERLIAGGLATSDGTHVVVIGEAFARAARRGAPTPTPSAFPDEPPERRSVLDQWVVDGRLTGLPTKWSQKLVVLDWVAQRFEPGVRYSERQVNAILSPLNPDTAALRRYMVDANIMDRANGEYWRSGGTVVTD